MRYAITDLTSSSPGHATRDSEERQARWLNALRRWQAEGIDFVQLREKALGGGELHGLMGAGVALLGRLDRLHRPKLLVNSRADVALAAGADGVHLPAGAGELRPEQIRTLFLRAGERHCVVSQSCHTLAEVGRARDAGCDLILFGPVFGKTVGGQQVQEAVGLQALGAACDTAGPVPVFALGGIKPAQAASCQAVGAAGVAGIRLFDASRPPTQP